MTTHPLSIVARIVEFVLGIIFISGAVLKLLDIDLFVVQIGAYGIFEDKEVLTLIALVTVGVELFLGVMLLLGFSHRWFSIGATLLLLVFFTGLVGYGWAFQDLSDCGCFGSIEISPPVTILKNLIMMAMGLFAWFGITLTPEHIGIPRFLQLRPMMAAPLALLVALSGAAYAYQYLDRVETTQDENGEERPFARFVFETEMGPVDLGEGEHLVVFVSADCEHCKAQVPVLNDLEFDSDLPPLVGLVFEENEGDMMRFEMDASPMFPLHSLGQEVMLFFNFIGQAPPRLYYVVDGQAVEYWDYDMPAIDAVRDAVL